MTQNHDTSVWFWFCLPPITPNWSQQSLFLLLVTGSFSFPMSPCHRGILQFKGPWLLLWFGTTELNSTTELWKPQGATQAKTLKTANFFYQLWQGHEPKKEVFEAELTRVFMLYGCLSKMQLNTQPEANAVFWVQGDLKIIFIFLKISWMAYCPLAAQTRTTLDSEMMERGWMIRCLGKNEKCKEELLKGELNQCS